jgi:3-oxoacyl-[acyl-carrier protein] reductase
MKEINGKRALITGASRGIGQKIAEGLAELGCNIILHARKKENLDDTLEKLESSRVEIDMVEGELVRPSEVINIIKKVNEKFGGVDILYNNAAIMSGWQDNMWMHTQEAWENSFQVNVYAMYYLCVGFVPGMLERGFGRVINLTSGIINTPQLLPYGVTKAAVDKLTLELSSGLPKGIRMNTLDPGWLKTDLGGHNADWDVDCVLPGALAPALIEDDGPNGIMFSAIDYHLGKKHII